MRKTMNERISAKEAAPSREEIRCECGSLVAKLIGSNIELKCRRCKRLALIPLEEFKRAESVDVRI